MSVWLRSVVDQPSGRRRVHHCPHLAQADSTSITFEHQKNDLRDVTVTQHCTNDATLCPVRAWAAIIQRVSSYPGASDETPVNAFLHQDKIIHIKSSAVRLKLRAAAAALGPDKLGFSSDEIGTHSLRSGAAMAMYLNEVPVYTIMLIGRWSSDAFLRYIRRQVQQFSSGVSARMIQTAHFFTVPETFNIIHDPRTPNNRNSLASNVNGSARATLPLWFVLASPSSTKHFVMVYFVDKHGRLVPSVRGGARVQYFRTLSSTSNASQFYEVSRVSFYDLQGVGIMSDL